MNIIVDRDGSTLTEKDKESTVLETLIAQPEAVKKPTAEESAAKLASELKAAEEKRLADLTAGDDRSVVNKDEEKVKAEAEALKAADAKLDDLLKNR